jgi:TatD DNase family protein
MLPLYDAHNHFHDDWLAPHRAAIDTELRRTGLRRAVVNGTCEADWPVVAALAREHDWILPSFGLHPWDAGNRSPDWRDALVAQLTANPAAPVGEIGLDRWILDRARPDDPRLVGLRRAPLAEQIEVFAWQLELAAAQNRAASIHCLDAFGPLLDVLCRARLPARGFLLHAYGGSSEMMRQFADVGAYFSFNSAFLDRRYAARQETFKLVPADRLLVETDAPAMPPPAAPNVLELPSASDGTRINHPANIAAAYATLADLRGMSSEALATQVEKNFQRLFG